MHSDFGIIHSATSQEALDVHLERNSATLVVVNFYVEGNEPCQPTTSFLLTASKQFEHVTFVRMNMNEVQNVANKYYEVVSAPAFIFLKNKTVLESVNGADQLTLQTLLDKYAPLDRDGASTPESTACSTSEQDPPKSKSQERRFSLSSGILRRIWHSEALQDVEPGCLPPVHVFNDILAQLAVTLRPSTQLRASRSPGEKPIFEPMLSLYCPLESGEYIIDATVKELASRTNSQVQVIDITHLAADRCGSYWLDSLPALNSSGISVPYSTSARERLEDLIEQILNSSPPEADAGCPSGRCPRLIYLRDFRFLAASAPSFYGALLTVIHKQLRQRLESGSPIPTAIILGVTASLDRSTPQVKSELVHDNWGYTSNSETPMYWDESSNAQSERDTRHGERYQKWTNAELFDVMFYNLSETGVFPDVTEYRSTFKYSRTGVVVPEKRNVERERKAREKRRLEINQFRVQMAMYAVDGELTTGPPASEDNLDEFTQLCRSKPITFDLVRCLADQAVGTTTVSKLASSNESLLSESPIDVTWDDLIIAWAAQAKIEEERSNWLESSMKASKVEEPEPDSSTPNTNSGPDDAITKDAEPEATGPEVEEPGDNRNTENSDDTDSSSDDSDQATKNNDFDEVVERVKNEYLDTYESRMLSHIVKPAQIQTGFDSVHLPAETIQLIRNLVSLPLICPEAFQTGILKQYNMTGALLFGPPGTGKTHLARAIAKESGSRMIMIKPSDIKDKYIGESEKIIDGLFKMARRLKPCIIFIDEIDALLGARTTSHDTVTSHYHTSTLTQFMQEMDGMIVSDVVVIGATNRPFDLDDAVVRRLPCRVLVDLPDRDAREAILRILLRDEKLEEGVDIPALAKQTERFSGSDLKNLCVMAAYESVKESAHGKMPWNTPEPTEPNNGSAQSTAEQPNTAVPEAQSSGNIEKTGQNAGAQCSSSEDSGTAVTCSEISASVESQPTAKDNSQPAPKEPSSTESIQARKISIKHFSRALLHVRASASDSQVSVRELHRWNRQFGSGRG